MRAFLLWLARERPRSASPVHRGLTRAILWLLPLCAVALLVIRGNTVPDAAGALEPAYPDACAELTPLVTAAIGPSTLDDRALDRDSVRCDYLAGDNTLRIEAQRPLYVSSDETPVDQAREDYTGKADGAASSTGQPTTALAGLGDEAVWTLGEDNGILIARSGPHVLHLTLRMQNPPPELVRAASALAAALLAKLPPG